MSRRIHPALPLLAKPGRDPSEPVRELLFWIRQALCQVIKVSIRQLHLAWLGTIRRIVVPGFPLDPNAVPVLLSHVREFMSQEG